jgi:NAD(P)-dependent dehydrogenase (short-subunit alcohol dehydrogenase family)
MRFENDVAIVTGGARGIGLATVERFASEGAKVLFCARSVDEGRVVEKNIGSDRVRFTQCDVGSEDDVERMVGDCQEWFGEPTILVNNAGINANFDAVTMTGKNWDDFMATDLKSSWLTSKFVLPAMKAKKKGAIVIVASIHSFVTKEGFFPYAAAKAGLLGLTRSLAVDYGQDNIRVNTVCPGFTKTRLLGGFQEDDGDHAAQLSQMISGTPLNRIAEPSEISSVIAFLASDEASFITGASLLVDGGLTARRSG